MKKWFTGFLTGALLFGTLTGFAVQYVAQPAAFKVLVNGEEFVSDPPALEVEGRTYLPLRAMGDALGVPVTWNEELGQAEVGAAPTTATATENVLMNDTWKLTYSTYQTTKEVNYFKPNKEGNVFLIVFFELENLSAEEGNFGMDAEYYVDDFKTTQTVVGSVDGAQQPILGINVAAGKKAKVCYAFEVSPNWNKVDMTFPDLFATDDSEILKFTLSK